MQSRAMRDGPSEVGAPLAEIGWGVFRHVLLSTLVEADERSENADALVAAAALDSGDLQDGQVIDDPRRPRNRGRRVATSRKGRALGHERSPGAKMSLGDRRGRGVALQAHSETG
jgi:hypothetical protein